MVICLLYWFFFDYSLTFFWKFSLNFDTKARSVLSCMLLASHGLLDQFCRIHTRILGMSLCCDSDQGGGCVVDTFDGNIEWNWTFELSRFSAWVWPNSQLTSLPSIFLIIIIFVFLIVVIVVFVLMQSVKVPRTEQLNIMGMVTPDIPKGWAD